MFPALLLFVTVVAANTESMVLKIPQFFDVPPHPLVYAPTKPLALNSTHSYLLDFPIYDKYTYPYQLLLVPAVNLDPNSRSLLVKLNNHENSAYSGGDLLYIKLCWPATTPYSFQLSHEFHTDDDLNPGSSKSAAPLSIYLRIDYQGDYYAIDPTPVPVLAQLTVSKLAWLPLPLELYDFIVYLVDISILLAATVPWIALLLIPSPLAYTSEHLPHT